MSVYTWYCVLHHVPHAIYWFSLLFWLKQLWQRHISRAYEVSIVMYPLVMYCIAMLPVDNLFDPPQQTNGYYWTELLDSTVFEATHFKIIWKTQQSSIFVMVVLHHASTHSPGQNGRYFADDILKCYFLKERFRILIWILLKFVPKDPIDNKWALVQVMAWRRIDDKPLPEPMLISSPRTHLCGTRGRWVNVLKCI